MNETVVVFTRLFSIVLRLFFVRSDVLYQVVKINGFLSAQFSRFGEEKREKKAKKRTTLRKTIQKSSHVFNNKERVVFSKKNENTRTRERESVCVCVSEKDECLPLVDVLEQRRKQARRSAF